MNKKILTGTLFIVIIFTISMMFVNESYACYETRPTYGISFVQAVCADNQAKKVAQIQASISQDGDILTVNIRNAYPGYAGYVNFKIKNIGKKSLQIDRVTITTYDTKALSVTKPSNLVGKYIKPGNTLDGQVKIELLNGAKQNWVYCFTIIIKASC